LHRLETGLAAVGKYLGLFGTAMKLVQLAPTAAGLALVFFSPRAWLSGTLRVWSFSGVVIGAALGWAALAARTTRHAERERIGLGALAVAVASAAILRFHFALVDLRFLERWPFRGPLHDFYLGSDLGERLYNLGAALGFALALAFATLGLPTYLRGRAERRAAAAPSSDPKHGVRPALTTLTEAIAALEQANAELRTENARLRAQRAESAGFTESARNAGTARRSP
jgi:hypothetical protein